MDFIKSKITSLATLLVVVGIGSSLLSFFNYNLKVLMWVDLWGTTVGWMIRIAFIIGGAALFLLFNKANAPEQ